jgi:hypothetical protein
MDWNGNLSSFQYGTAHLKIKEFKNQNIENRRPTVRALSDRTDDTGWPGFILVAKANHFRSKQVKG